MNDRGAQGPWPVIPNVVNYKEMHSTNQWNFQPNLPSDLPTGKGSQNLVSAVLAAEHSVGMQHKSENDKSLNLVGS